MDPQIIIKYEKVNMKVGPIKWRGILHWQIATKITSCRGFLQSCKANANSEGALDRETNSNELKRSKRSGVKKIAKK